MKRRFFIARVLFVLIILGVIVGVGCAGLKVQDHYIEKQKREQAQIDKTAAQMAFQEKLKFPLRREDI